MILFKKYLKETKRYLLEGAVMKSNISFKKVLRVHIYQVTLILITLIGKNISVKKPRKF